MSNHLFSFPHLWSITQQQSRLNASLEQQTSQEALNEYFTGSPSCYLSDPRSTVPLTLPLWPTSHWRSSQPFRDAIKAFVCSYLGCMHIRLAATKSHWLQPCTGAITFYSAENCQTFGGWSFLLVFHQFVSFFVFCYPSSIYHKGPDIAETYKGLKYPLKKYAFIPDIKFVQSDAFQVSICTSTRKTCIRFLIASIDQFDWSKFNEPQDFHTWFEC